MLDKLINQIGNWNPQLFREIKGRLKSRNLTITAIISSVVQLITFAIIRGGLPTAYNKFNRYCVGLPPEGYYKDYVPPRLPDNFCHRDALGNVTHLFHQLWWLDLFTALSIVGIFALLVGGTYLLIADLSKEDRRGTLNFIRLSPQSAKTIFIGKVLGVPVLIFVGCLLALPLHLTAGILAHIPFYMIGVFYLVALCSCAFFFNAALLFGLVSSSLVGFQSFLGSGVVLFFLFVFTSMTMDGYGTAAHNSFDWLSLFYPGVILHYLTDATFIQPNTIDYLQLADLQEMEWYGQTVWNSFFSGTGFILANYCLWTYWLTQGVKRRFHNPETTLLLKDQSYWMTACFGVLNLGFALQTNRYSSYYYENFALAASFNLVFFLLLTATLSPHRQELQDWMRYRHQTAQRQTLLKELLNGSKSPSTLAMAMNIGMMTLFFIPAIFIFPLPHLEKVAVLSGLILCGLMTLLYVTVAQRMLLIKTKKRAMWATVTVGALIILPLIALAIVDLSPYEYPLPWLFTLLPIVGTEEATMTNIFMSMVAQTLVICVLNWQMTRQLKKVGTSETK